MAFDELEEISEQFEDIKEENNPTQNSSEGEEEPKKKQKKKPKVEQSSSGGLSEATWRYGKPLGNGRFMDSYTGKIYREIKL